jgi:hypothetical protein
VQEIGWRSEIGAALFPGTGNTNACQSGKQVFASRRGDPITYAQNKQYGPVTQSLSAAIATPPGGGTPIASTLKKLTPTLVELGENTFVILITDGGPNCNDGMTCGVSECMPNIEKIQGCTSTINCCDPKVDPGFTYANCLDQNDTLTAISQLNQLGVKTLVIGMPGSSSYTTLLNAMAVVGGSPRETEPRYYPVEELTELSGILSQIGSDIAISCDFTLNEAPSDPTKVNLYFDNSVVKNNDSDGWTWLDSQKILLHGTACNQFLSGKVNTIKVFVGCDTEVK